MKRWVQDLLVARFTAGLVVAVNPPRWRVAFELAIFTVSLAALIVGPFGPLSLAWSTILLLTSWHQLWCYFAVWASVRRPPIPSPKMPKQADKKAPWHG